MNRSVPPVASKHTSTLSHLVEAAPISAFAILKRDDFSSNRHPALAYWWSMIFSENRYPLFGIMLYDIRRHPRMSVAPAASTS
jgi:hypothetical protein